MVGIAEGSLDQTPGMIPAEPHIVEKNPHQLRDRDGGMRVVHLNGDFFRKQIPVFVVRPEAAQDIVDGAGAKKKFLQEPQFLTDHGGVVRVQHSRNGFGGQRFRDGAHEIAVTELVKVERVRRTRRP